MRVWVALSIAGLLASGARAQDEPAAPPSPGPESGAPSAGAEPGAKPGAPAPVKPASPVPQPAPNAPAALPSAPAVEPPGPPPAEPAPAPEPAEPAPQETPEPELATKEETGIVKLDAAEVVEDKPESEKSKLPWMAALTWGQSYNAAGLTRGDEQTYNPTYSWSFGLSGGYRFDELTTLKLTVPLAIELTDSDSTTTRQELLLLDASLDLSREFLEYEPASGQSLDLNGSARLLFPTSIASRARTMVLGTRVMAGVTYAFENVLKGLALNLSASYLHRFNRSNTVETETSFACLRSGSDISESCSHLGGLSVTRDLVAVALAAELGLTKNLMLGLGGSLGWNRASGFSAATVEAETGEVQVPDASTTHWRNTRVLSLLLGYSFTDWFSAQAGIQNEFPEIANGERRGPLNAVDTELTLELSVSFDELYASTTKPASQVP